MCLSSIVTSSHHHFTVIFHLWLPLMFSNGKTKALSRAKRALKEELQAKTFKHKDTGGGGRLWRVGFGGVDSGGMVPGFYCWKYLWSNVLFPSNWRDKKPHRGKLYLGTWTFYSIAPDGRVALGQAKGRTPCRECSRRHISCFVLFFVRRYQK